MFAVFALETDDATLVLALDSTITIEDVQVAMAQEDAPLVNLDGDGTGVQQRPIRRY